MKPNESKLKQKGSLKMFNLSPVCVIHLEMPEKHKSESLEGMMMGFSPRR